MTGQHIGHILWTDLTVPDAENIREFYERVIGWTSQGIDMGGYNDHMMKSASPPLIKSEEEAATIAGICHAQGSNAGLPAQWINYFGVADLDKARAEVTELGGQLRSDIRRYGNDRYCVIEDPAGAVCGLFEMNPKE
ncbi:MAG: VOC family protein [bacterium]